MKQLLKMFAVIGIVLLAALISAGSCDKKDPEANKNTNNNGSPGNPLMVTGLDATVAKMVSNTIYLKASAFPATKAGDDSANFEDVNGAATTTRKKAFEVVIDKATGGMVVVLNGDITKADDLIIPAFGSVPTGAAGNKGVHVSTGTAADGTMKPGANIFSVFADKTVATTANLDAKKAPFAFSPLTGGANTQPIFWCVATLTELSDTTVTDASTKKLTGGQKADCYVASVGASAIGGAANDAAKNSWFEGGSPVSPPPVKKEVALSVVGIRTDDKPLNKIGLKGASAIAEFTDGLNKDDVAGIITEAKKSGDTYVAYKAYTIKIVTDADFTAAK